MEVFMRHIFDTKEFQLHNTVVCLGKFDGIHKGHRLLIETIKSYKSQGLETVVFNFALHPYTLFSKGDAKLIDTMEEKVEKLESLGVDTLVSFPFTQETANIEAVDFIKEILVKKIDAKVIVVGKDCHFGRKRQGDVQLLREYAEKYNYKVVALEKLLVDDQLVSSTRVRKKIQKGYMETVTKLLGVPYAVKGEVLHGKQLGRTIGMPTINQAVSENKILPPKGVYVSRVYLENGIYGGITNLGTKPTVSGENQIGVETHIFDFDGDLYGKIVKTELLYYVRGEQKFNTLEELKTQMHKDMEFGKKYLQRD